MRKLIRYEQTGNNIWALWEGEDGERWYEQIVIEGIVQWFERLRRKIDGNIVEMSFEDVVSAEEAADEIERLRKENSALLHSADDVYKRLMPEVERLREALKEIYEIYAGSEGIPQPMTASEGYLLHLIKEMANTARAALKGDE